MSGWHDDHHVFANQRLDRKTIAVLDRQPDEGNIDAVLHECAHLIDQVLGATQATSDTEYRLEAVIEESVTARVRALCRRFPLPGYPCQEQPRLHSDDLQPSLRA